MTGGWLVATAVTPRPDETRSGQDDGAQSLRPGDVKLGSTRFGGSVRRRAWFHRIFGQRDVSVDSSGGVQPLFLAVLEHVVVDGLCRAGLTEIA